MRSYYDRKLRYGPLNSSCALYGFRLLRWRQIGGRTAVAIGAACGRRDGRPRPGSTAAAAAATEGKTQARPAGPITCAHPSATASPSALCRGFEL